MRPARSCRCKNCDIKDVVTDVSPKAPGTKQMMAAFRVGGKPYAVPIGVEKDGDFKCYSDEIFFIEDPHDLYKHWPADVWKAIDEHRVQPGMNELQSSFAIGVGIPEGSGDYGSRTLALRQWREARDHHVRK